MNRNNPHYIPVTETVSSEITDHAWRLTPLKTSRIRRQVVKVKAPQGTHRRSAVHETSTSKPDSGKAKIIQPGETRDNAVLPSAKPVTSGKKRQAEDEPEVANAKKLKLSGLEASGMHGPKDNAKTPTATDEVSGSKDTHSRRSRPTRNIAPRSSQGKTPETLGLEPTTEADLESVPKGMRNHSHCCFANAGIQCLSGAAEFSAIYEGQAGGTLEDLESLIVSTKDLDRKGKATRKLSSKRHQFRAILKGIKESM